MLRLRTLGGLSIENAGSLGGATANRRPLSLLALLAINGSHGLSRDTIVALLWPESEPDRARNSLSQVISVLRRELTAPDLLLGTVELRVNPDVLACDVVDFEQRIAADDLDAATRLYTGPFLEGVFLKNTPEFERWVDLERSRLEHLQGDALERLATRATAAQDHVSAVRFWRRRASLVPTDSRAARELMAALVASGDPAGALAHYRAHRALLRHDLGLEPGASLVEFAAVVRQGMILRPDREWAIRHARVHAELVPAERGPEPDHGVLASAEQLLAAPTGATRHVASAMRPDGAQQVPGEADAGASGQFETQPDLPWPSGLAQVPRFRGLARRRRILLAGAGIVGVIALGRLVTRQRNSGAAMTTTKLSSVAFAIGRDTPASASAASASARLDDPEPTLNIGRVLVMPLRDESHDTSAAPFGRLAADWMASGLAQTGLIDVVDAQTAAGLQVRLAQSDTGSASARDIHRIAVDVDAKTLVLGRYYRTPDSLFVQVMIEDAVNARLVRTLPKIAVPTADYSRALALLRDKVAGAFATLVDPRVESLVDRSTPAPSLIAYHAYAEGLDCYIRSGRVGVFNPCNPAPNFEAAIRADSSWTLPYIWLMYEYRNAGRLTAVDSLIGILDRRHERLSELDRNGVEFFERLQAGDAEGSLRAARRAAALAPRSSWAYQAAFTARQLSRYKESLTFLRQLDPEHGWVRGWWPYVQSLAADEDALGHYGTELSEMEAAEKRDPGTALYIGFRLVALAGLGDSSTIVRVVDSLIANPPVLGTRLGAILQSALHAAAAHGHPQLARQIADRCLAAIDPPATVTQEQRYNLGVRADCLYAEGRWGEAKGATERLLSGSPPLTNGQIWNLERSLVRIETRLGDSAAAALHMRNLLSHAEPANRFSDSMFMLAHIAAIRGMKARTVELLRQMPMGTNWQPTVLLTNPDFRELLTYPPFRALVAPRG